MSLGIPSGQFIAVLGPNGSGKSTLAKHLNALLIPSDGTVWIDGKDSKDLDRLWEIRRQIGMVFQDPDNEIIGSSVEEDVAFGPECQNLEPSKIKQLVADSLERVGLSHLRKSSPMELSGGQKQRLAIADALAAMPDCLVLDEPTAMLDPSSRAEVISTVKELNRMAHMTIVLITHHTDEVLDADSIILMKDGRIIGQGTPSELFGNVACIQEAKMDIPQVVELGLRLKQRGFDIELPTTSEESLISQILTIYNGVHHG